MNIDLIVYPLILWLGYKVYTTDSTQNRKNLILWCSFILLLKTSLRSVSVGSDTCHYALYFHEMQTRSWHEIWTLFADRYFVLGLFGGDDDMGYQLISKFVSMFTDSFGVFTFVMQGMFFFLPIGIMISKYCTDNKQIVFAYVLLNTLFMGLPMANARQVYAVGLSVASFLFLTDRKYVYSLLCLTVAATIHKSALLSLVPLMLYFVPQRSFRLASILSFFIAPFTLLNTGSVISAMGNMIASDKYADYGHAVSSGGAITYIMLSLMTAAFCTYSLWKSFNDEGKKIKLMFAMIPLTVIFCPLIYNNGSMIRITLYFQIFFLVLMPMALNEYFKVNKSYILFVTLFLMALSIINAEHYIFFWQESQDPSLYW